MQQTWYSFILPWETGQQNARQLRSTNCVTTRRAANNYAFNWDCNKPHTVTEMDKNVKLMHASELTSWQ